jgi:hypothetical protein
MWMRKIAYMWNASLPLTADLLSWAWSKQSQSLSPRSHIYFNFINGEKILPLTIEGCIKQHPLVHEAVVVGLGKAAPALLILRSPEAEAEIFLTVITSIPLANHLRRPTRMLKPFLESPVILLL